MLDVLAYAATGAVIVVITCFSVVVIFGTVKGIVKAFKKK